ncbi:hypothetical protein CKAN_00202600 [Cinnamomum micranthum f. kanehirae]|uniref:Uncharacterized protein n=1 Tax=Cinnamomum micranthum f. kanehirae TaxID=337451 RepID=A0A443N5D3_9MAGN|nr:hypothetical protein CKAN_00202600 [Cinnamomum micranthum f. kanehirae]
MFPPSVSLPQTVFSSLPTRASLSSLSRPAPNDKSPSIAPGFLISPQIPSFLSPVSSISLPPPIYFLLLSPGPRISLISLPASAKQQISIGSTQISSISTATAAHLSPSVAHPLTASNRQSPISAPADLLLHSTHEEEKHSLCFLLSLSSLVFCFLFSPGRRASLSRVATPVYQMDCEDPFDGIQLDLQLWLSHHSQLPRLSQLPVPFEIQNPSQSTTFIPSSSFQSMSLQMMIVALISIDNNFEAFIKGEASERSTYEDETLTQI